MSNSHFTGENNNYLLSQFYIAYGTGARLNLDSINMRRVPNFLSALKTFQKNILAGPFSSNIFNKLVIQIPPSTKNYYSKKRTAPQMARLWGRGINSNQMFFKINSDYIYSKCFIFHDKVQFYCFPVIIWPQNWSFYIKYFTYRRIGSVILPPTGEHLVNWSRKENMFFTIIFFADSYFQHNPLHS